MHYESKKHESVKHFFLWILFHEKKEKCLKILNSFPFSSALSKKRVSLIWNIFIIRKIYFYLWSLLLIFSHNMHSMLFLLFQTAVLFKATNILYQSEWNKLAKMWIFTCFIKKVPLYDAERNVCLTRRLNKNSHRKIINY